MPELRDEVADDRAAIRALLVDAFAGTGEADLVEALHDASDLAVSLVAVNDQGVIGHVALSWLRSPAGCLALAPVAVASAFQRKGAGTLLVAAALARARHAGAAMVFVLGDPAWYARFGFSADAAAEFPCAWAGPHFMALRLGETPIAPAPLVYAPAFDALS